MTEFVGNLGLSLLFMHIFTSTPHCF